MNNVDPIWWVIAGITGLAVLWAVASMVAEIERERRDRREARSHLAQWRPSDEDMQRIAADVDHELHDAVRRIQADADIDRALHNTHDQPREDCAMCEFDQNRRRHRDDPR